MDSSVGKDFDKVFSDICNKFRKKKNYDFRREFLSRIDPYYMAPRRRWRYNGYYLDENRIIRSYDAPEKKRKKVKVKVVDRPAKYFTANTRVFKEYPGVREMIPQYLGNILSYKLFHEKLPMKYYSLVIFYIEKALNYLYPKKSIYYYRKAPSEFLLIIDESEYVTYYEGERKFYKYLAETKDASNKVVREKKKKKEIYLSSLLNSIEAKRKSNERLENEVTRDRLGFAEDSFTGEFYHGQKRKKRRQSQNTEKA
ncbi:hypothetical protein, partial [Intestinibacter sp.]|uniref:hypothetical protein n=1 Tax=Intestinibacter sp. TaxID=1965304 RepID=UPI003F18A798